MMLLIGLFIAATFVTLPLAVYVAASRLLRPRTDDELVRLALLVMPLAPLLLSLLLMALYSTPLQPTSAMVIAAVLLLQAALLAIGGTDLQQLGNAITASIRPPVGTARSLVVVLAVVLVLVVVLALSRPLMENDTMEYMAVARHIFQARSLSVYPLVESAPNGLFAPPAHPPAYHMYLVWGYSWLGTKTFAPARLLSLFSVFGMISLLACALWSYGQRAIMLASLLVLSTPLYVSAVSGYTVDPLRLVAFLAAVLATARLIDNPVPREAALAGIVIGLAAFSHSIGILAVVFGGAAWLLLGPVNRFRDIRLPLIVGALALLVGGGQYIKNTIIFGVPLHDTLPVWEMPELHFGDDLRFRRDLVSFADRMLFGVFRGFIELPQFGLVFWLMLPALWLVLRGRRKMATDQWTAVVWLLSFVGLALATSFMGLELVIKNPRYQLTLAPLAAMIAAPLLASMKFESRWSARLSTLALVVIAGWTVSQALASLYFFAGRPDIALVGERAMIYRPQTRFSGAPLYVYIEQNLKPGEKTLAFRQADFTLYGTGPWIDNFDTSMQPFYRLKSVDEAHRWLRDRGIRFVLLPPYTYPTYYRSVAGELLSDARWSDLVGTHFGSRLYRLRDQPVAADCQPISNEPLPLQVWNSENSVLSLLAAASGARFLGRQDEQWLGVLDFDRVKPSEAAGARIQLGHGYGTTVHLATGRGQLEFEPPDSWARLDGTDIDLTIRLTARGRSFMAVDVVEYVPRGQTLELSTTRLWDGVVDENLDTVVTRYLPSAGTRSFRLVVRNIGRAAGQLEVSNLSICKNQRTPPSATAVARISSPTAPSDKPTNAIVKSWPAESFAGICRASDSKRFCEARNKSASVRWQNEDRVQLLGSLFTLSSADIERSWSFALSRVLEAWRVRLDGYPDSTFANLTRPLYERLAGPVSATTDRTYRLQFDVAGNGAFRSYIQYRRPDGTTAWRYAGTILPLAERRTRSLSFTLPEFRDNDLELILVGSSASQNDARLATISLDTGPVTLMRD